MWSRNMNGYQYHAYTNNAYKQTNVFSAMDAIVKNILGKKTITTKNIPAFMETSITLY